MWSLSLLPSLPPPSLPPQADITDVKTQATAAAKVMNLSVIRLCFQAFLMDEHGRFTVAVDPVFSHKVYDSSESLNI